MKTILIRAEVPDETFDFDSFVDIKSRDGIVTIENGKSIKAEIITPPTDKEIHELAILNSNSPREAEWIEYGAKLVLKQIGL